MIFLYLHSMTLKKQLGIFDLTMIIVSFVIGMGIFRTPANVAAVSATPLIFYLCWIAGGIVALCGAMTYAEIGSRVPTTGGYYTIFAYAYHPSIAFAINCIILVSNAASMAAVSLVGSEYIVGVLLPASKDLAYLAVPRNAAEVKAMQVTVAIVSIIIFYGINMLGLRTSSRTQNVLMLIKIGLVILLIMPLFFVTKDADLSARIAITASTTPASLMEYIKGFGIGLMAASFTYGGYQQTMNLGGEVKQPNRNIPRGIFASIILIVALYLLVNIAYVKVIGFEELKTSKNIAAIMASKIFGSNADIILSVLLFFGVLAYINGSLLSNPRVMYAMGHDKVFPRSFTITNRFDALKYPLTLFAAVGVLIVFWAEEFDRILSFTMFLDCFGMALSAGTIFYFRKKTKHLDHTGIFKMKLFPLLPVIFIAAYVFIGVSIALDYKNNNHAALTGIAVLAVFMAIYYLFHRKKKKLSIDN